MTWLPMKWPPALFRLTPELCVLLLLVVEVLLFLSNWLAWPEWHKGYPVLMSVGVVSVVLILMLVWYLAAFIFRLRFQFSVRSLLMLTVAVALPSSWLAAEMKNAREQRIVVEAIRSIGGGVDYDFEYDAVRGPPEPHWLRQLLGQDFFSDVACVTMNGAPDADAALRHVSRLTRLKELSLRSVNLRDADLKSIEGLTTLQTLDLSETRLTDRAIEHLRGLKQLRILILDGNPSTDDPANAFTDAGLEVLRDLGQLESLDLEHGPITDAGFTPPEGTATTPALGPQQHPDQRCWPERVRWAR